jgi:hypothetical protein
VPIAAETEETATDVEQPSSATLAANDVATAAIVASPGSGRRVALLVTALVVCAIAAILAALLI